MAFDPYEYIDPQYRDPEEEWWGAREAIAGLDAPDYAPFSIDEVDPLPAQQLPPPPPRDLDALMSGAAGTAPDVSQVPGVGPGQAMPMSPDEQSELLEFIQSSTGVTPEGPEAEVMDTPDAMQEMARRKFASTPSAPAPVGGAMISGPGGPAIAAPTLGGARQPYRDELPFDRALRMQRDARQGAIPLDILSGVAGGLAGKMPTGPTFGEMRSGAVGRDLIREGQQAQRRMAHERAMAKVGERRGKVAAAQQKEQRTSQANAAALQSEYDLSPEDAAAVAGSPDAMRIVSDSRKHRRKLQAEANTLKQKGLDREADHAEKLVLQQDKHDKNMLRDRAKEVGKRRPGRGGGVGLGRPETLEAEADALLASRQISDPTPEQRQSAQAEVGRFSRKKRQELAMFVAKRGITDVEKQDKRVQAYGTDVGKLQGYRSSLQPALAVLKLSDDEIKKIQLWAGGTTGMALPEDLRVIGGRLQGLKNLIVKERSGAAVSVQEFQRLQDEMGTLWSSSPAQLRDFLRRAESAFKAVEQYMGAKYGAGVVKQHRKNLQDIKALGPAGGAAPAGAGGIRITKGDRTTTLPAAKARGLIAEHGWTEAP